MTTKTIHVSCAIIENRGTVLCVRRSSTMAMPLKWEFPGGKLLDDESPAACLVREVREELGVIVSIRQPLTPVTHHYPVFTITLYPFICSITEGSVTLHEHAALVWLPPSELSVLDWADADRLVIEEYLKAGRGREDEGTGNRQEDERPLKERT